MAARGVPADDAAVVQVTDAGEVELAVTGGELGDIGDPSLVRCRGREVAVQQVRQPAGVGPATPPFFDECAPTRSFVRIRRATRDFATRTPRRRSWP